MNLKVMTFNLLYAGAVNPAGSWPERLPLVVDVLKSGADLIGLQEAEPAQIADIRRELPEFTVIAGPDSGARWTPRPVRAAARMLRRWRGWKPEFKEAGEGVIDAFDAASLPAEKTGAGFAYRGEHCAILYRTARFTVVEGSAFWLSHRPHQPASVLRGTWLPRVVHWARLREQEADREVTLYVSHFDYLPWAPTRSARIIRQILDSHWEGEPQILVGDFNAGKYSPAYRTLCRQGAQGAPPLMDAWLQTQERIGPEVTYHGGGGRSRWPGRLDRIYCRPAMTVKRVTTVTHHLGRFYPSDHFPVLAELRIKQNDDPDPL